LEGEGIAASENVEAKRPDPLDEGTAEHERQREDGPEAITQ
jgi:hypothetical protein